jgi:hypothetical protein
LGEYSSPPKKCTEYYRSLCMWKCIWRHFNTALRPIDFSAFSFFLVMFEWFTFKMV